MRVFRRHLAVLFTMVLAVVGLGVVSAPPASAASPVFQSVVYNPVAGVFSSDSALTLQATLRVTVDRTDTFRFDRAFITDRDCENVFSAPNARCPFYAVADSVTPVGATDVIHLVGVAPNAHPFDGTLARTGRAGLRGYRTVVIYRKGTLQTTAGSPPAAADMQLFSDERTTIAGPSTVAAGGALTIAGLAERFDRSWVDDQRALQLQFNPDGGDDTFANVGGEVQSSAEGAFTMVVPSVGATGVWRVVSKVAWGALGEQTIVSNPLPVTVTTTPPPPPPPIPPPSAPIVTLASATSTLLSINFSPPAIGTGITEYQWAWSTGGVPIASVSVPAGSQPNPFTISGLTPSTSYLVTVRALGAGGLGAVGQVTASTTAVTVPPPTVTVPGAPTSVTGKALNDKAKLKWKPPSTNGGSPILGYQVHRRRFNDDVGADARRYIFTGLKDTKSYILVVRARNAAGFGPWSVGVVVTPR